jgi:hypothetical protein
MCAKWDDFIFPHLSRGLHFARDWLLAAFFFLP